MVKWKLGGRRRRTWEGTQSDPVPGNQERRAGTHVLPVFDAPNVIFEALGYPGQAHLRFLPTLSLSSTCWVCKTLSSILPPGNLRTPLPPVPCQLLNCLPAKLGSAGVCYPAPFVPRPLRREAKNAPAPRGKFGWRLLADVNCWEGWEIGSGLHLHNHARLSQGIYPPSPAAP